MKSYDLVKGDVRGLDVFEDSLKSAGNSAKYHVDSVKALAQIHGWFLGSVEGLDIVVHDDLAGVSYSEYSGLQFSLAKKDSKLPHKIVQLLGFPLTKKYREYMQDFILIGEIPEGHTLRNLGLKSVSIAGYLPETCKLVEIREPLSEDELKAYEDAIANGKVKFKTECGPEPDGLEADFARTMADHVVEP